MIVGSYPDVGNLSPDEYVAIAESAFVEHRTIPQPATVPQLQALIDSHPDVARQFLPAPKELARLGISRHACREIPPLSIEWRERFLMTMTTDADFRAAVSALLVGARR